MEDLQRFFLFCSGSNFSILKRTPTEVNKYVGIGATIFFTGLFAAVACAYAIYTVFSSYILAIVFGLLWGLMIFNLDRYIVSTIKKKGNFFRDFFHATPRIALAILIAIVIAKPLELKIFDSEIRSELALMQQEKFKEQEEAVHLRFDEKIDKAKNEITALKAEVVVRQNHRDALIAAALVEADGTGGSQLRNMGPIYRAKKAEADRAEAELAVFTNEAQVLIAEKQAQLAGLESTLESELNEMDKVKLDGFAARLEALERVGQRSEAIYIASIFIMLLFIAIETAPIFVKLISSRSPYDYVLDKHEYGFEIQHKRHTSSLYHLTKNEMDFQIETNAHKTGLAIEAEKEMANQAIQDHVEQLKKQPMLWRDLLRKGKLFGLE